MKKKQRSRKQQLLQQDAFDRIALQGLRQVFYRQNQQWYHAFDTIALQGLRPYFWIALLGLIVYFQSLFFQLIYFDDNVLILDQQYFISQFASIFKAFGRDVFGMYNTVYYRPLYTVSLVLNGVIAGTDPLLYHLTNGLLHVAVCCLIFKLLCRLKYQKFPALLVSLLFTVLPVLTQAVVWIPGRNDLLLLETTPLQALFAKRKPAVVVLLAVVCFFAAITVFYSRNFRERLVFWEKAVEMAPHSPLAHRNLGAMYAFDGLPDKAEAAYRHALQLNPAETMVHNNLGALYMEKNLLKEAEQEFREELKLNPGFDRALFNMGLVKYRLQNREEAIRYWLKAVEVNDMKLDAYYGLALAYQELNNTEKSQYYFGQYTKRGGKLDS